MEVELKIDKFGSFFCQTPPKKTYVFSIINRRSFLTEPLPKTTPRPSRRRNNQKLDRGLALSESLEPGSGMEEEEEEEQEEEESCVSVRLRGSGEVERRWRDGRLELSYQNGNKKIIRQGRSQQVVLRSDKL